MQDMILSVVTTNSAIQIVPQVYMSILAIW